MLGVAEQERSVEVDLRSVRAQDHVVSQADRPSTAYLRPALEGAPLGAHEHVLEVQLHIRVHPRHGYTCTVICVPQGNVYPRTHAFSCPVRDPEAKCPGASYSGQVTPG